MSQSGFKSQTPGHRGRRQIIVTADDFGAATSVNEAVELAHRSGILNTASLMVCGAAADDAVYRAKRMPALHVGLHVVLVDGRPMLDPARVPALVDEQGNFSTRLVASGFSFFARPEARRQLATEVQAQFQAFARSGLKLDHVNAHNHMHLHPTVLGLMLEVGAQFGVRAVRVPYEPFGPSWSATHSNAWGRLANGVLLAPMIWQMRRRLRLQRIAANDFVFGLNDTGRMNAQRVVALLAHAPQGTSEFYFHPATARWPGMPSGSRCEEELAALTNASVRNAISELGMAMTSFSELCAA